MSEAAPTRASLLLRLRDQADAEAWSQFVEIYSPLIFRFARRCHLQESDAADLVQEVMFEVAKSIAKFDYDPKLGRFRSWLYRVAKRTMSRVQRKQSPEPRGVGDTESLRFLASVADDNNALEELWDQEYQRQLIHWAAAQIRNQFQEATWQAFWLTAVEEQASQVVADRLGLSVGSVYVAKSRVMKRISEKIREIDESH
ncbi:MAG: sigma-70 family RNA polymerase sigma factor [Planctomycetota bacterium]